MYQIRNVLFTSFFFFFYCTFQNSVPNYLIMYLNFNICSQYYFVEIILREKKFANSFSSFMSSRTAVMCKVRVVAQMTFIILTRCLAIIREWI